jgi:hypothetical protein
MYFPYLRGKQFELLAIREIGPRISEGTISPILEPVKKSTDSLERALDILRSQDVNYTIIINPIHGDFANNPIELVKFINQKLASYENFQIGILLHQFVDLDAIDLLMQEISFERSITLIHTSRLNDIESLANWVANHSVKYNLFSEGFPVRRYRGIITPETKVILEDRFKPQAKNADYVQVPDEFFSDDHIYFEDDGFIGFSDYVTIGNDYSDTGFLPYAVAIHLTYQKANGEIWIRHFVSDSNSDSTDPGGKFGEALEKLIEFVNAEAISTAAADDFRQLHHDGHYPGLGTIKKLSIKHHLELVQNILLTNELL